MKDGQKQENSLTSRVTVGKNEFTVNTSKGVGVPDGLVEERRKLGLEASGAGSSHDLVRESNVRAVVVRVEINTVPAAGEHELKTDTVKAVGIKVVLVGQEVTVQRSLGSAGIVEAVEAQSLLLKSELADLVSAPETLGGVRNWPGEVTETLVTRDHLEALRESSDVARGVAGVGVQEVVCEHTTDLGDDNTGSVGVHEVKRWSPVSGLVLGDLA